MRPNEMPVSPEATELLGEIRHAFQDVRRRDGVTLHETYVVDMYGSEGERRKARRLDVDHYWWEVRDEWIEKFGGNGGLSFLDDEGFRYYLPAYMSYFLRKGSEPNCLTNHLLRGDDGRDFDHMLSATQKAAVAKFLSFVTRRYHCLCPEVFETDWKHYLKSEE